jgi:hypothetical protein
MAFVEMAILQRRGRKKVNYPLILEFFENKARKKPVLSAWLR